MLMGYRIPGSSRGQAFSLPDWCYRLVGELDADEIASGMRARNGKEPTWQSVRGALLRRARDRQTKVGSNG